MIAVVPRILGALFYYAPNENDAQTALTELPQLAESFAWRDPQHITALVNALPSVDNSVCEDFSVLFEGQGEMPAPPWASVYLNVDNIVMGPSTLHYCQFLSALNLSLDTKLNEPEDQFGLMMFALAMLLEQENDTATMVLLEEHLLSWCFHYLSLIESSELSSTFYVTLAKITSAFLEDMTALLQLTPRQYPLYR